MKCLPICLRTEREKEKEDNKFKKTFLKWYRFVLLRHGTLRTRASNHLIRVVVFTFQAFV